VEVPPEILGGDKVNCDSRSLASCYYPPYVRVPPGTSGDGKIKFDKVPSIWMLKVPPALWKFQGGELGYSNGFETKIASQE